MEQVTPHNFSHSPVHEVLCSCTLSLGTPLTLRVLSPYPGWKSIKSDLHEMLSGLPDSCIITDCILKYTDIFHPVTQEEEAISDFLGFGNNDQIIGRILRRKGDNIIISTTIPKSEVFIKLKTRGHLGQGSTLFFTVQTASSEFSRLDAMDWFDAAHKEIHDLFDLLVPQEIIAHLV